MGWGSRRKGFKGWWGSRNEGFRDGRIGMLS